MIDVKTFVGGFAIAGSLGLATLGFGAAVANAAPDPVAPQVTPAQGDARAPHSAPPSPYAAYGDPSICGTPGLYFTNICA